jgi:hypothetical protein
MGARRRRRRRLGVGTVTTRQAADNYNKKK